MLMVDSWHRRLQFGMVGSVRVLPRLEYSYLTFAFWQDLDSFKGEPNYPSLVSAWIPR